MSRQWPSARMLPLRYARDMSQVARRHATYEDVLAAPEHHVAQVIDGELHVHPRPAHRHTRSASARGAKLLGLFDEGPLGEGGDWIVLYEPELHLASDIVVRDLAAWRVERFPGGDESDEPFFTVAPDWVCEILSTSTARVDRIKKVPVYAREGVGFVWLVDPRDRVEPRRRAPRHRDLRRVPPRRRSSPSRSSALARPVTSS